MGNSIGSCLGTRSASGKNPTMPTRPEASMRERLIKQPVAPDRHVDGWREIRKRLHLHGRTPARHDQVGLHHGQCLEVRLEKCPSALSLTDNSKESVQLALASTPLAVATKRGKGSSAA